MSSWTSFDAQARCLLEGEPRAEKNALNVVRNSVGLDYRTQLDTSGTPDALKRFAPRRARPRALPFWVSHDMNGICQTGCQVDGDCNFPAGDICSTSFGARSSAWDECRTGTSSQSYNFLCLTPFRVRRIPNLVLSASIIFYLA